MIDYSDIDPFGEENWEPKKPIDGSLNKQLIDKIYLASQNIHRAGMIGQGNYIILSEKNIEKFKSI